MADEAVAAAADAVGPPPRSLGRRRGRWAAAEAVAAAANAISAGTEAIAAAAEAIEAAQQEMGLPL